MKGIEILSPAVHKTVVAQSVRALVTVKWTYWGEKGCEFFLRAYCLLLIRDV